MRKAQKQEILEMIQTLHEAHDEIKNNIDRKNFVLAQDMLSQCQECAISIGTAIENLEGEGFVTVSFVESYCDVLFSTYEELNGKEANANKIHKNLKKQLLRIENSVKNDVPIRKEVAFFPYKASMWDALESVYLAAKEDPNCDAYCVPIPYYDRNPDRSLGQMHYEGNEYPKNIEVIDWKTYNFEERKPDVIYIHNPYDDWNLVTCVHPRYFSANLKKYTDKLVYIPYFVLDEIEPDDQAKIDSMKHFVLTPGVINADRVIVQSEKMKQIYVNEYLKAAQANGLQGNHIDRKYLEEKFLGLGSPKFDKVQNTKKENLEIPEGWLNIIEKPDGSWKKIIFYNTSIAALLEHNEKMLEKMKDVFRIFKENQDEVALLWRPHPLIKSAVSAMRPNLWEEYEKLANRYRQERWGIYDDSSDLDRAIVLSDAYYGDASSVLQVYKKTNKHILIQNAYSHEEKNGQIFFCSYTGYFEKEKLYLISEVTNAVIVISKSENKIEKIYLLENEEYINDLSISFFLANKNLVVVPYNAQNFHVINLETGKQNCINGIISDYEQYLDGKFLLTIICNDRAWIIGENVKRIIEIDLNSFKTVANIPYDGIEGLQNVAQSIFWSNNYVIEENKIILPSRNYGVVLCIDSNSEKIYSYNLSDHILGYSCIYKHDKHIYMIDNSGYEYALNTQTFEIKRTYNIIADACYKCITMGRKKYYFGSFTGKIFMVEDSRMQEIEYNFAQDLEQSGLKFQFVEINGENIYFQERFSGNMFVLDTKTDRCCQQEIDVSGYMEKWRDKTIEESKNVGGYLENAFVTLDSFLLY